MAHTLTFDEKIKYPDDAQGINLDVVISKESDRLISATVKLDTGSTFCIFQRFYADLLGIEVEKGEKESIRTAKGKFTRTRNLDQIFKSRMGSDRLFRPG